MKGKEKDPLAPVNDYTTFFNDFMPKSFPRSPLIHPFSFFFPRICMSSKPHQAAHFFHTLHLLCPSYLLCCSRRRMLTRSLFSFLSGGLAAVKKKKNRLLPMSESSPFILLRPLPFTSLFVADQYCSQQAV